MATFIVYSDTTDASISSNNADYATARAGSNLSVNTTDNVVYVSCTWTGAIYAFTILALPFNTSGLSGGTVTAANLSMFKTSGTGTEAQATVKYANFTNNPVQTSDWKSPSVANAFTTAAAIDDAGFGTFTVGMSGVGNINTSGTTYLGIWADRFLDGTVPTTFNWLSLYSANNGGTASDPKLTITYTYAYVRSIVRGIARGIIR